jgi:serine/threonine protein kinase
LNLHDLVSLYGPKPEARVIHILVQICDSLKEAHGVGLIHRDIKPGNVFLCDRGGISDCVKVLDFGLVREYRNGSENPRPADDNKIIEGTPWFTAPEAIENPALIDPRSDIYAVGALGYFLLTQHYIFDAETVAEIHQKQLAADPIPASMRTTNPISAEMEQILLSCLAKDPSERPQSAEDLRALLLTCPAAGEWTVEARAAWWAAYRQQPAVNPVNGAVKTSTPMATVRIDLASRVE